MRRAKKAYWNGDVVCPCCQSELQVVVTKKRTSEPAPPPDYDWDVNVTIQKNLFPAALIRAQKKAKKEPAGAAA